MRTLILSCNTGEGHNSCARAIRDVYEMHGVPCEVQDSLSYISPLISDIVSGFHASMYRSMPKLFSWGYSTAEKHPELAEDESLVDQILKLGAQKLKQEITDGEYEAVICTHPFSALILKNAIKKYRLKLHTAFVATDYTCSPTVRGNGCEFFFIPDDSLTEDFRDEKVPDDHIIVSGIPVRQIFFRTTEEAVAKEIFGVKPGNIHILLASGSIGGGPVEKIAKKLLKKLPENAELSIICGRNKTLHHKLEKTFKEEARVHVLGFVEDMSTLYDSADLLLTKPGGLTSTEAVIKDVPLLCINAVAGCEDYNGQFFFDRGVAIWEEDPEVLVKKAAEILKTPEKIEEMRQKVKALPKRNGAKIIFETLEGLNKATEESTL